MRIDSLIQGNNQTIDNMNTIKSHEKSARIADETFGYTLDISSKAKDITAYGMGELESFEDICNKAAIKDVSLESDAYAVMSNSMSASDFAKLTEDGNHYLSYIEMLLPFNFGIPGVKIGLANIAVVFALYKIGTKEAFVISDTKKKQRERFVPAAFVFVRFRRQRM